MAVPPRHNKHPALMFEIIAKNQPVLMAFYRVVFGWEYVLGTGGFAYIKFPMQSVPLLGGIGQASAAIPGFEPGCNFYLCVDSLIDTLAQVIEHGGSVFVEPTPVDGYQFAMFKDPEGNAIGLIEPFLSTSSSSSTSARDAHPLHGNSP